MGQREFMAQIGLARFFPGIHIHILREKKDSLWPYHPECARSHLILEAKQGQAWLVLGWEEKDIALEHL